MKKSKNTIAAIIGVIAGIIVIILMIVNPMDHIEDTNGADNYALQTITDENIINMDIGCLNLKKSNAIIGDTVTYSSDKFTGVEEIYVSENIIFSTSISITVNHAQVNSGNFRIVLIHEDEIIHEFKLNELSQTYVLEDFKGEFCLRIAGESADFSLDFSVD